MERSKNNTWLLILMIISQIMLTGLVAQWLRSQWQNEKEAFQKDINLKFTASVDQVMDSMLVKHLITPVLKDSTVNGDHLITFNKKVPPGLKKIDHQITAYINDTGGQRHTMIAISIPDSDKSGPKENPEFSAYDSNEKKILLRSVKLIIRNSGGDSVGNWHHFNRMISSVPDTLMLKKLFETKLGGAGTKYDVIWISDSTKNKSDIKSPVMYFKTNLFEKPLHMEIIHYQKDILRNILPQVIFAVMLLLITAAAFFFTYRSLRKQEALNTLRNDFVRNISHELKTPVATVSVALDALKNFDKMNDRAKSNEYLGIAYNEMKRLDQLITEVLNTSVLEEQSGYLKPENADAVALIRNVLNSMAMRFEQTGAKVEFITDSPTCILTLDKLHIHGVLINLLDNSLKYSEGEPVISIRLEQHKSVIIRVSDNGQGIPEEYISRVFDKFFRVPKGDTHDIKGYGLGLSFAKLVMEQHSGSITVKNKSEGGCEFTLTFPRELV
jgi:signal transduction histidine kinase